MTPTPEQVEIARIAGRLLAAQIVASRSTEYDVGPEIIEWAVTIAQSIVRAAIELPEIEFPIEEIP